MTSQQLANDPINSRRTTSSPALHFSCSRSRLTWIQAKICKKRLLSSCSLKRTTFFLQCLHVIITSALRVCVGIESSGVGAVGIFTISPTASCDASRANSDTHREICCVCVCINLHYWGAFVRVVTDSRKTRLCSCEHQLPVALCICQSAFLLLMELMHTHTRWSDWMRSSEGRYLSWVTCDGWVSVSQRENYLKHQRRTWCSSSRAVIECRARVHHLLMSDALMRLSDC